MSESAAVPSGRAGRSRRAAIFAAASALLIFGGAWLVGQFGEGAEFRRAVWTSAWIAFVVQILSWVIAQPFLAKNPIAGWGLGSVLRLFVLVLYAVVGLKLWGLEATPALVSLVGFLFVSMLIESILLKP